MKIYYFDTTETPDLDVVGGKGNSLITMTQMGLNVPYGFVIATDLWQEYNRTGELTASQKEEILQALKKVENRTGQVFGDKTRPLIISTRSGARFSMPGMMETILDVGITPDNLPAVITKFGKQAALSSYQQFLRMFGHSVLGISHKLFADLEKQNQDLESLVTAFSKLITAQHQQVDLNDSHQILFLCIEAVLKSFNSPGAVEYRNMAGIDHNLGTAVIIQQMVFGNLSLKSGSAVVFSRNFETGSKELFGHYLPNSQGENVVRGYYQPLAVSQLPQKLHQHIYEQVEKLEAQIKNVVDVEVTWEDEDNFDQVYILQSRQAKLPTKTYFQIQESLLSEGLKKFEDVFEEVNLNTIHDAYAPIITNHDQLTVIATGSPLNTGIGVGQVVLDIQEAKSKLKEGADLVLVCPHFDPNDLELLTGENRMKALITTEGGPSSHMGLVLNVLNIPGVMGAGLDVDNLKSGETLTVDSHSGKVYQGRAQLETSQLTGLAQKIKERWDEVNGTQNNWADFVDEKVRQSTLQKIITARSQASNYTSIKAGQTHLINTCFSPEIAIYTDIIPAKDIQALLDTTKQIKQNGQGLWMRSAYTPDLLQAPYTSTDLTTVPEPELADWLENPESAHNYSKFGSYQSWQTQVVETTNIR